MGSVNKALEILDLFLNNLEPMGISDVVKMVGMNQTTTYRIMATLVKSGYLEQLSKRGKYAISPKKLMAFSNVITPSLRIRNMSLSFLQELSTMIQETTEIAIRLGNVAFKDDYLYSSNVLNVQPSRERIIDLYSTGTGKILLAEMSEEEFREYCENVVIRPLTPNTITELAKLKSHLVKINKTGVAYDFEEHELGIVSVAVPVKDSEGNVVAAISVIAPSVRINKQRLAELSKILKDYAKKISQTIS